jgi:hypothetical protein
MKRFIKKSICLLLALMIIIGTGNTSVQAETLSVTEVEQTDVKAASSGTTIKVTKADESTAKKLHEQLLKGKKITLKVKGSKSAAKKLIKNLQKKIQQVNGQAVLFQYELGKKSGSYYLATISADNAKLYKYSIAFIDKIYTALREEIETNEYYIQYLNDCKKYPNERERKLREIYDSVVNGRYDPSYMSSDYSEEWVYTPIGADEKTTELEVFLSGSDESDMKYFSKKDTLRSSTDLEIQTIYYYDSEIRTFEEFASQENIDKLLDKYRVYGLGLADMSQEELIVNTKNFSDLSDAMKIYALVKTRIFQCRKTRDNYYGIVYTFGIYHIPQGSAGMKALLDNKAEGVCQVYASYEILIFDQLGITSYFNRSSKIGHAWSVVKVKNTSGKTLWIPIDYGIGPSNRLSLSEKQRTYVNTEAKRYKLYLSGIKGAPSKKNFTYYDFD